MSSSALSSTPPPSAPPMRGFAIAGAVVLLGLLAMMFGSSETEDNIKDKRNRETRPVDSAEFVQVDKIKSAHIPDALGSKLALNVPEATEISPPDLKELSLTKRLDDFFLNNVALENLPLGQAMAMLKQMLLRTDKQKALALHKLIVSIPTAALGRLVTLHSTSISYLEAVKTLAAMAGCDVDLGEHRITLKVQAGAWPQVATKRSLLDILDGFMDENGKSMKDDAHRMAWLKHDARRMGLQGDDSGNVSMTESQWQALTRAQEYRRQLELSLIPPYAVYILPEGYLQPIFQVTPPQVLQLMASLYQQGFPAYSDVPYAVIDASVSHQILTIRRYGETVQVSMYNTIAIKPEAVEEVAESQQASAALRMEHASISGDRFDFFKAGSTDANSGLLGSASYDLTSGAVIAWSTEMLNGLGHVEVISRLIPVDDSGTPVMVPETAPAVTEGVPPTAPAGS